jgi:hypothetical protein
MRLRRRRFVLSVVLASAGVAAFGAPPASAINPEFARMTGAQEVPGPGDGNGHGVAFINVKPAASQACVAVRHRNIDPPAAMHIHRGATGVAGPIVIDFSSVLTGGCVAADPVLLREIRDTPSGFYINIHNGAFPAGAIRGQLDPSSVESLMPFGQGPTHPFARMSGALEVPGPGDGNGRGAVFLDLKPSAGQVCADERYTAINPGTGMHIHRGAVGVAGPIVVDLTPALSGTRCVAADPALVREIRDNPAAFYVNIHNGAFPAGAIRGQLE